MNSKFAVTIMALLAFGSTAWSALAETPTAQEGTAPGSAVEEAPPEPTLGEALAGGEAKVGLRYRYETVSDDTAAFDGVEAHASTLRVTLSYRTLEYEGLSLFGEFERVADIGLGEKHNSTSNGITDRPVVADPEGTYFNQIYLGVTAIPETTILAGRQEILIDNVRFVGNVGWRQHHQTFDAVKVVNTSIPKTQVLYSYIGNVHRILGDTKPMDSHLINVGVNVGGAGKLTGYSYLLDYEDDGDLGLSTATYGARFVGGTPIGSSKFLYEAELAVQSDFGDNPNDVEAHYLRGVLGLGTGPLTFKGGIEILSGNEDDGRFTTPLATLHAFNGWADLFLATPPDGLQDVSASVAGNFGAFGATAIYHDFRAETGDAKYGSEVDLQVTYKTPWKVLLAAKAALYDADMFRDDKSLFMLFSTYSF
jgi:hypothetical protein